MLVVFFIVETNELVNKSSSVVGARGTSRSVTMTRTLDELPLALVAEGGLFRITASD